MCSAPNSGGKRTEAAPLQAIPDTVLTESTLTGFPMVAHDAALRASVAYVLRLRPTDKRTKHRPRPHAACPPAAASMCKRTMPTCLLGSSSDASRSRHILFAWHWHWMRRTAHMMHVMHGSTSSPLAVCIA